MPMIQGLRIRIFTSDIDDAGTDSWIYFGVFHAGGGKIAQFPDLDGNENERGTHCDYHFGLAPAIDSATIRNFVLINGYDDNAWHVARITIWGQLVGGGEAQLVDKLVGQWLESSKDNSPAFVISP